MSKEAALSVVDVIANLVFAAQFLLVGLVIFLILRKFSSKNKTVKSVSDFVSANALSLAFFVALFATAGSLFLSEIAHFTPCKLCWYQRIAMYPQVVILGIAAIKNDFIVKPYVLAISIIGALVGIYHYALQMSPLPLPCTDEVANCALKQIAYFGYITIPLMSLTAFLLIIALMMFIRGKK